MYVCVCVIEFGTVNRGVWSVNGRNIQVAVKVLKDTSAQQKKEFQLEADTMCSLDHKCEKPAHQSLLRRATLLRIEIALVVSDIFCASLTLSISLVCPLVCLCANLAS